MIKMKVGRIDILTIASPSIHEYMISLHLIRSWLLISSVLYFSAYKACTILLDLYMFSIIFGAIVIFFEEED